MNTTVTPPMAPAAPAPAPTSKLVLHDYQKVVKDFIVDHPHCAAFLPMGLGKTSVVLDSFNTIRPQGDILVVAPLNIVRSTWLDEIEKWGFNVRTRSLIVDEQGKQLSREKRLARYAEAFRCPPTMYFVNQDLIHDLVEYAGARFDQRITQAMMEHLASKVSPELFAKISPKFCGRDDADVLADLVKELRRQVAGAGKALEKHLAGDDNAAMARRNATLAAKAADLVAGVDDAMLKELEGFPRKWARANNIKLRPAIWPFQTVVLDESQGFKNPSSRRFQALRKVRPTISRLIELTGTPTPQGLLDLWSQMYLLDQGHALGASMSQYKDRWFLPSRYVDNRPVAWVPKAGTEKEIHEAVRHLVMSVENTSLKIPDVTINDVLVHLDDDEMDAYKDFQKESVLDLVTADDGQISITAVNAAVLSTKLTQFASGTIYTDPDTHTFEVVHHRKLEHLDYILRNASSPVIVAYRFVSDRIRLMADLAKLGHDVHLFDGSRGMVAGWNAGRYPVMMLQPASAGHGLNLQDGGHTMVWYTLPVSLEHYMQTNARLHRQGQTNPVIIHRLLTKGTYDQRLPGMLNKKRVTQDDLIQAVTIEIGHALGLDNPFISVVCDKNGFESGFDPWELL